MKMMATRIVLARAVDILGEDVKIFCLGFKRKNSAIGADKF